MIHQAIERMISREDLLPEEATAVMNQIAEGNATGAQIGSFLTALRMKGATAGEIASFARVMQECAVPVTPQVSGMMVDTCGTGGDRSGSGGTFNISTAAGIVAAAAGVLIVKHGNRSVSSRCGSADVLETLGVTIEQTPEAAAKTVEETGIGFFYAPRYHPAMRHVAPVRKELGIYTVFNILGPLLNPARAQARLIGVYDPGLVMIVADALRELGVQRAMVVHGEGLDEITVTGSTFIAELNQGTLNFSTITPEEFGIARSRNETIRGGNPEENAAIIRSVLSGTPGPCQDIVALNAGAAIYLGGKATNLHDGVNKAYHVIRLGKATEKLDELIRVSGRAA
ncbi:MAG: anthranilate phosphoribosyltransferase [Methanospirillum sp.]|uniref:anthranilate phosphoribosyltransferase n=1 Tax=Methanospirillum sp. TaxID=45200 RepID=UPI0023758791|nr:anthranilate phosphoribosyltransferase [Methanospirillum sp.]MDD1727617.1 anthranilate phosphoribosyltransferase [Methanospirillum sp.]